MHTFNVPQPETQLVIDHILKAVAPCTIFLLGYQKKQIENKSVLSEDFISTAVTHHFFLLVFANKTSLGQGTNIANAIAEKSNKSITATILLHKLTDLATKQDHQQRFFGSVLRSCQRLHFDKAVIPFSPNNSLPERNQEVTLSYWHKCVAVAQFNSNAAASSPELDVELCKIALLHTATVQIALGLLRVMLEYTPNECSLNHLLQLCGLFTNLPETLFFHQNPTSIKRYKMLCAPASMLNHWTKLNANEQDFLHILNSCQEFLKQAELLVQNHFQQINNNNTKSLIS